MTTVASRISRPIETVPAPIGGNRVRSTFSDKDSLREVLADMDRAQHKIQFETFLLNAADGKTVTDMLIKKARQGVKVQVLLDGFGRKFDFQNLAKQLREGGVEVLDYNTRPLKNWMIAVDHAKIVVVDDAIGWVGGANFDFEQSRDMMTRIEGPAVKRLQETFNEGWQQSGGRVLPVQGKFEPKGDVWIGISQTAAGEQSSRTQVLEELNALKQGDEADLWMMELADHTVLDALEAAHARGVKIRVMLDMTVPVLKDKPLARTFDGLPDHYAIGRLLAKGVDVRRYVLPEGIDKLHAKVWVFTRNPGTPQEMHRVIGGSVNALKGAYEFNHEVGFVMYGGNAGREVKRVVDEDFRLHTERYQGQTPWQRTKGKLMDWVTRSYV